MKDKNHKPIPSSVYDKNYYLSLRGIEGFSNFVKKGKLVKVYQKAISYYSFKAGDKVLDVGCGRGEIPLHLARWGIDVIRVEYSKDAIEFAQKLKKTLNQKVYRKAKFVKADCTFLPFQNNYFDCVFMIDVVEHLTPEQMTKSLEEAHRVLKNRGLLVIHTNNFWFEKFAYWLIAASYYYFGVFKEKHIDTAGHVHINYLSKRALKRALKRAGFGSEVEVTVPVSVSEI